jgi:hypothetical protein
MYVGVWQNILWLLKPTSHSGTQAAICADDSAEDIPVAVQGTHDRHGRQMRHNPSLAP